MVHVLAPQVDPGGDIQALEVLLQDAGIGLGIILPGTLAAADDDVASAVLRQQGVIGGHVADEIGGGVVVDLHIGVVLEEILGVEQAAQRQAAAKQMGEAEIEVDTVVAAHAGAGEHYLTGVVHAVGFGVDLVQAGQELLADVLDPLLVPHDAGVLVTVGGAPGLLVYAGNAEQLQLAVFDLVSYGIHHAAALEVKELTVLAGEDDEGQAGVAVNLELHVTLQIVRIFLVVLGMHFG